MLRPSEESSFPVVSQRNIPKLILKSAGLYLVLVFGAGFVLGTIRVLLLVPRFGERLAELMEVPLMMVVIVFAAKWVLQRFAVPPAVAIRLAVGLVALTLIVLLEFTLVLRVRGLTLAEYFRGRDPVSGTVYYLMLVVFALMPVLVARRQVS